MRFIWDNITSWAFYNEWTSDILMIDDIPHPPQDETEELTATISTNESITVPIGWNV